MNGHIPKRIKVNKDCLLPCYNNTKYHLHLYKTKAELNGKMPIYISFFQFEIFKAHFEISNH